MFRTVNRIFERIVEVLIVQHWTIPALIGCGVYFGFRYLPNLADWQEPSATVAQYASVMAFLLASPYLAIALVALIGPDWALRRLEKVNHLVELRNLDGRTFETVVADIFRAKGYIAEQSPYGPDGGIDIVLRNKKEVILVQCKAYRDDRVDVAMVRELFGVLKSHDTASRAIFATVYTYTQAARDFAKQHGKEIQLLDQDDLVKMISEIRGKPLEGYVPPDPEERIPECPICGKLMNWIPAERNPAVGRGFYGCSSFAKTGCKGKFDPKNYRLA